MAYLLDTDWAIEALAGRHRATDVLARISLRQLQVSWVTVAELYEGAYNSPNPQARLELFREFLLPLRKLGLNDDIAERFAELRAMLRRQGNLIPDLDLLQATIALQYDSALLTFNIRHFRRIPGLRIFPAS